MCSGSCTKPLAGTKKKYICGFTVHDAKELSQDVCVYAPRHLSFLETLHPL